jgi:cytochrome c oxidase cbb3-type subunit III
MNNDNPIDPSNDVIQHASNPVPRWWQRIFVTTIAFAPVYILIFHSDAANNLEEGYGAEVAAAAKAAFAEIGDLNGDEATLVSYMQKPEWIAYGQSVFKNNCVSCHGTTGGGSVGPNLCDEEYLHIEKIDDIFKIVNVGANRGAMPAWTTRLEQNDRVLVSAYVASLRGSNPGGSAKGPQGKVIPAWPR